MKAVVIYVHGKGGNAEEVNHYKQFLIIDDKESYFIGASIKDAGKRIVVITYNKD